VWPEWLRRIQFIQITFPHLETTFDPAQLHTTRFAKYRSAIVADESLHSLCSFLASEHRLRSFKVAITNGAFEGVIAVVPTFSIAPQMLGRVVLEDKRLLLSPSSAEATTDGLEDTMEATWTKLIDLVTPCLTSFAADRYSLSRESHYTIRHLAEAVKLAVDYKSRHAFCDELRARLDKTILNAAEKRSIIKATMRGARHVRYSLFETFDSLGDTGRRYLATVTKFLMSELRLSVEEFEEIRDRH
jgi:hypothetical protein